MCDSFATPWTVAYQAPLSMGFPRQKYWSELPFPSPGDLPDLEIEPISPALAGRFLLLSHQRSSIFTKYLTSMPQTFQSLNKSEHVLEPRGTSLREHD